MAKIADYELKIWEFFLKSPRHHRPETFLGNMLKVEIHTEACVRSPFESDTINLGDAIGIGGGDPGNRRGVVEFSTLEVTAGSPPIVYKRPNFHAD